MYVIAGPNGAGKTTLSYTILPELFNCDEFINADEIAKGISPLNPEKASIRAGRLMLERIKELFTNLRIICVRDYSVDKILSFPYQWGKKTRLRYHLTFFSA